MDWYGWYDWYGWHCGMKYDCNDAVYDAALLQNSQNSSWHWVAVISVASKGFVPLKCRVARDV